MFVGRNARYSPWDGSQVGFEFDALDVFAELTDDLAYHGDVMGALRRLLQDGMTSPDGHRIQGLREILEQLRELRQSREEQFSLGGEFEQIAQDLREIIATERAALNERFEQAQHLDSPRQSELARSAATEAQFKLDFLPPDLAGQVRELQDYSFTSPEAAERFNALIERLRAEMLQQYLDQVGDAVGSATAEDLARTKDMMAELNAMLDAHQRGEDVDFDGFMSRYGDMFPENPSTLDELLEAIARRMAAMSSLLASMTPEQREQYRQLSEQLLSDLDLRWQADQLGENLRRLFPQAGWDAIRDFDGVDPLDLGASLDMLGELNDLDQLERLLASSPQPGALADVDLQRVRELMGDEVAASLEQLSSLARDLEQRGLVQQRDGRLELSAAGIRRLGQNALAEVFRKLHRELGGNHSLGRQGQGHERLYETKPYEWGDPFTLNLTETLQNAIRRSGADHEGSMGRRVSLSPQDFAIEQTETNVRAATVLMLDLSLSMPMRDNFLPAKKVALALQSLISSMFPRDYLGVVTFSETAAVVDPHDIASVSWDYVYGTNMEHGFMLARRLLARQNGFKQILMITDGEPTAHLDSNGEPVFHYPPTRRTVDATLAEVMRCTREAITINTFMLDADQGLQRFIEQLTELNRGRAFFTDTSNLGDFVLVDFLEQRRSMIRRG